MSKRARIEALEAHVDEMRGQLDVLTRNAVVIQDETDRLRRNLETWEQAARRLHPRFIPF